MTPTCRASVCGGVDLPPIATGPLGDPAGDFERSPSCASSEASRRWTLRNNAVNTSAHRMGGGSMLAPSEDVKGGLDSNAEQREADAWQNRLRASLGSPLPLADIGETRTKKKRFRPVFHTSLNDRLKTLEVRGLRKAQETRLAKVKDELRERFEALPQSERHAVADAFALVDESDTGLLDRDEVVNCLWEIGLHGMSSVEKREVMTCCKEAMLESAILACRWNPLVNLGTVDSVIEDSKVKVNLHEFAVIVVPQVRQRLLDMRNGDLLKEFFRHDVDRDGRLSADEIVDAARTMGLDQRPMLAAVDGESIEVFQELVSSGREVLQRSLRERERQVKAEEHLDDTSFRRFRKDLPAFYDCFVRYPTDSTGRISHEDMLLMLKEFGLMPRTRAERAEMEQIILKIDKDVWARSVHRLGVEFQADTSRYSFRNFLVAVNTIRALRQERIREEQLASFEHYDKDHGGDLSVAEISLLLSDLGIAPRNRQEQEELAMMIHAADEDGSGTIDFEEFQDLSQRIDEKLKQMRYEWEIDFGTGKGFNESQLRDFRLIFDSLDVDGSERLTALEVSACFTLMQKRVPQETLDMYFKQVDSDGHGELDFSQFLVLMRLVRESDQHFTEPPQKIEQFACNLDIRILRRTLERFRISKAYLLALSRNDLLAMFCDYLGVGRDDDLHKTLKVQTVAELYDSVSQRRNDGGDHQGY
eukprot:CAMPEP_0117620850 /NCGR_PEP_ID=MMETSP0784-20121206/87338_1 /TAXON_ID=39447 /ORGANISM="" /LENGTH=702 /DNA_ID=CAMNT_0005424771 /DNA_START=17 /DNA_END=2125 /DNA_ORIENTATION=-